jgi:hypothetical protein
MLKMGFSQTNLKLNPQKRHESSRETEINYLRRETCISVSIRKEL